MARKKNQKNNPHYVDNVLFYDEMVKFRLLREAAESQGEESPACPKYIADCFLKIATHYSHRPQFMNYMFRDDMIMDGVEVALRYMHNFDDTKYKNPFAYFTQIIYFSFLQRIKKEKKCLAIKHLATTRANVFDMTSHDPTEGKYDTKIKVSEYTQEYMDDFVETFEANRQKNTSTKKRVGVDKFISEQNENQQTV